MELKPLTVEQFEHLRKRMEGRKDKHSERMMSKLDKLIVSRNAAKTDPPVGLSPAVPANPARARRVR